MKLILVILISILSYSAQPFASDERKLYLEVEAEKVFQGEIYLFQFVAYPASGDLKEKIEEAANDSFINGLKVIRIVDSGFSENNADAYVLKFEALVLNDKIDSLIDVGGEQLSFEYKGESIIPFTEMSGNLLIRELAYSISDRNYLLIGFGLLALFLLVLFGKKYLVVQRQKNMMKKNRNNWKAKLNDAKTREDFEFLYSHRTQLLKALDLNNSDLTTLVATMEELQYKRTLSPDEIKQIEQEFEKLRMQIR